MFLRHTPLLEVNQANIRLVVLDTCNQNFETLISKTRQNIFVYPTFKCELILMLVTSSRKNQQLEEDRLQEKTISIMIGHSFVPQKSEQTKLECFYDTHLF